MDAADGRRHRPGPAAQRARHGGGSDGGRARPFWRQSSSKRFLTDSGLKAPPYRGCLSRSYRVGRSSEAFWIADSKTGRMPPFSRHPWLTLRWDGQGEPGVQSPVRHPRQSGSDRRPERHFLPYSEGLGGWDSHLSARDPAACSAGLALDPGHMFNRRQVVEPGHVAERN